MSWGPSFNFSIWHVKLMGIDDQENIKGGLKWFNAVSKLMFLKPV